MNKNFAIIFLIALAFLQSIKAQGKNQTGYIFKDLPEKINKKADYLFYLHGKIVEAENPRPLSEKYGMYEYEKILETFKGKGFIVISEPRPKGTDIEQYGKKVAEQIQKLIDGGVSVNRITVVGASQGSWITMLASTYLKNRNVKFVIIAGCNKSIFPKVDLAGKILSIYEESDGTKSCKDFRKKSANIKRYKELKLNTGLEHGFIYRPLNEWITPVIEWARK